MTSTPPDDRTGQRATKRSLTSRTSLITAAAIAGVLVAGTAAVAANIGILNAADSSALGDLTATDELLPGPEADADTPTTTPTTTVATQESTTATSTTTTTTTSAGVAQQYDIAGTGTVWVLATRSGIALDHVATDDGWISTLAQSDPRALQVDFVTGDRTIVFTAALADDGAILVDVTEPTTVIGTSPTRPASPSVVTPTTAPFTYDDEYDDEYEHDEYEHDEYDDDEHDDDDERDEYEGADDDD